MVALSWRCRVVNLDAHLDAQLRVEIRQRLVEQEDLGLADDRPAYGNTLTLTARQGSWLALQIFANLQDVGGALDLLANNRRVELGNTQPKRHVLIDVICG